MDKELIPDKLETPVVERNGLLTTIKTSRDSVTFCYERHDRQSSQQLPADKITEIAAEDVWDYPTNPDVINAWVDIVQPALANEAKEREIPVFGIDCHEINLHPPIDIDVDALIMTLELGVATSLFLKLVKELSSKKLSRRNFLKLGTIGSFIGVTWFSSPVLTSLARGLSTIHETGEELSAQLFKLSQTAHPELNIAVLTCRNLIMAQKLFHLLHSGNALHIGMNIGAEHVGIEEAFMMDEEERLACIKYLSPFMKRIYKEDSLTHFMRYKYKKTAKLWQHELIKIPQLANIFTPAS